MVQTYGIANESSLDPTAPDVDESRALLGGGATGKASGLVDGRATIVSCISNLLNTIIGSGACFFFEVPLFGLCSHSDTCFWSQECSRFRWWVRYPSRHKSNT